MGKGVNIGLPLFYTVRPAKLDYTAGISSDGVIPKELQ